MVTRTQRIIVTDINKISIRQMLQVVDYWNLGVSTGAFRHMATSSELPPWRTALRWRWRAQRGQLGVAALTMKSRCVGMCHLKPDYGRRSSNSVMALTVHPNFAGHGIGGQLVEAIIDLATEHQHTRITARPVLINHAAIRTLERAGFELEGTQPSVFRSDDGELFPTLIYGRQL